MKKKRKTSRRAPRRTAAAQNKAFVHYAVHQASEHFKHLRAA